jgi:5-(carboxyamino)imidazole ribonucleotide synthase
MLKLGILGGGQLGRMLLQAAANYPIETFVLENEEHCPAAHLCHHFTKGDIRDFDTVYQFGRQVEALTIEIESVNVEALEKLEAEGVRVYPKPHALRIIRDKIQQKTFYRDQEIPSAPFRVVQSMEELKQSADFLPAVNKLAMGGYDGRGVQVIQQVADIEKGFDAPGVLEQMVTIRKEIAQIVAIGANGEMAIYPPVEMVFQPYLNLLDYQLCPADIPEQSLWRIEAISLKVAKALQSPGIFAIEFFISDKGDILVNETAPRVHNSGHHTIEAHYCSQFDMLIRLMAGYPLGNTGIKIPSAMVNLVGEPGYEGPALYKGLDEVLTISNAFVHIYGKVQSKPGRKMGHVTITSTEKQELIHQSHKIKRLMNKEG